MTTRCSRSNAVHERLVWILYEYEVDEVGVAPLRHGSGNNNSIEKPQETQLLSYAKNKQYYIIVLDVIIPSPIPKATCTLAHLNQMYSCIHRCYY